MKFEIKQRIIQLNNGEVPNGYEKTEFGIFPCDWVKDKAFGDLFDFYGGLGKSREELGEEGHAYLHYGDLHRGSFNVVSHAQYEHLPKYDVTLKGSEAYLMEDGDVAFLDASEDLEGTSRSVLIDNPDNEPFIAGLHVIFGKSKDNSLEKWYKQYITATESVRKQFQRLASGFKVYGVTRKTLPKIQIAYPKSADEQSKIAEILMKWDEMVELQEQYIQKLEQREHSVVKTTINSVIGESKKIKECVSYHPSSLLIKNLKEEENGFPVYGANDITMHISTYSFECNAVAIIKYGSSAGRVSFLTGKHSVLGTMAEMLPKKNINIKYIYYVLKCFDFKRYIEISTTPNVYFEDYAEEIIQVPNKNVQDRIVKELDIFTEYISLQKEKFERIKTQRKTLQQYLLNGIVRVEV